MKNQMPYPAPRDEIKYLIIFMVYFSELVMRLCKILGSLCQESIVSAKYIVPTKLLLKTNGSLISFPCERFSSTVAFVCG